MVYFGSQTAVLSNHDQDWELTLNQQLKQVNIQIPQILRKSEGNLPILLPNFPPSIPLIMCS